MRVVWIYEWKRLLYNRVFSIISLKVIPSDTDFRLPFSSSLMSVNSRNKKGWLKGIPTREEGNSYQERPSVFLFRGSFCWEGLSVLWMCVLHCIIIIKSKFQREWLSLLWYFTLLSIWNASPLRQICGFHGFLNLIKEWGRKRRISRSEKEDRQWLETTCVTPRVVLEFLFFACLKEYIASFLRNHVETSMCFLWKETCFSIWYFSAPVGMLANIFDSYIFLCVSWIERSIWCTFSSFSFGLLPFSIQLGFDAWTPSFLFESVSLFLWQNIEMITSPCMCCVLCLSILSILSMHEHIISSFKRKREASEIETDESMDDEVSKSRR